MSRRNRSDRQDVDMYFVPGEPFTPALRSLLGDELVKLRTTPVTWGIPCDELGYSRFWIKFQAHAHKLPWDDFAASEGTYLPKARNFVHNKFLKECTSPLLMMLDSDILFPPYLVDLLERHHLPMVGGWYRDKKAQDHHPVVFDFINEDDDGVIHWKHRDQPGKGVERVDGMGAGCWLMRREVAEALGEDPYDLNSGGEDLKLSRSLMRLGIPLHVDWSINCAHIGVGHT